MDAIILKDRVTSKMSDEEFFWFCQENKDLRIERNSDLEIIIMSPVYTISGFHGAEILRQLSNWNHESKSGVVFDSSTGFTLTDRSVLSPDASWLSNEKWNRLSEKEKYRFAPVCPEFVIEVRSKTDSVDDLKRKMLFWIKNGAELAWLVDPIDQCTFIFSSGNAEKQVIGMDKKIAGDGPVKGFILDLLMLKIV